MSRVAFSRSTIVEESERSSFSSADDYDRGFRRRLALQSNSGESKYSEEFQNALRAYFQSYGLLAHPRLSEWWADHLGNRVAHAFNVFIPWVQALAGNLDKTTVLEIGCGTGSSTIALAAHAASVVACDIHAPSLEVARLRLNEDGLAHKADLLLISPDFKEISSRHESFDVIVLYGVVEHMLPEERIGLFRTAWKLLRTNGHLVLYETPNRLRPRDRHTTGLLWWSWLPPKWALGYGKWRRAFDESTDLVAMYRLGFGLTYWDLKKLLRGCGTNYEIRYQKGRERRWHKALLTLLATAFRVPRWAFNDNLNVVIEKV